MTRLKSKNTPKNYEIERSPLYRLASRRKLSELLQIDLEKIDDLEKSSLHLQYRIFKDKQSKRLITEPVNELLRVHRQLLKFFRRITPPDYIHSAVKKRSYKTNAEEHLKGARILKIDIKSFYHSVKFDYVHRFFLMQLHCSEDVATILAKLCTVRTKSNGVHLPTGSCISPVLSFLVNRPLFDAINNLCNTNSSSFTLYVDDITISGKGATRSLLARVAKEIYDYGYKYHKIKTYEEGIATVTGLIITGGKLALPHERAKKIRQQQAKLSLANEIEKPQILSSLIGRLSEAEQIVPAYSITKRELMSRYAPIWSKVVSDRTTKSKPTKRKPHPKKICVSSAS